MRCYQKSKCEQKGKNEMEDLTKAMKDLTEAKKMANDFSNFVNCGDEDDFKEFVDLVTEDHRTLQQLSFKLFLKCIKKWSDFYGDSCFDLRNEFTVKKSKEIIEKCLPDGIYVPYI